ncbi:VOC family protein [Caldibacillus lycopersici]|uniref:VOC family protein n=1 Tax=Perspicuibacillus lycopersici TaxID=1325689 RepID=A0AAE3IXG8_9BACI|nr:VOC family protein [Perspicuibacillus lycopersici]MCU9614714.1 VOC family protein [Perspicuibacillus lycopersici]
MAQFKVKKLNSIVIHVTNLDASYHFYKHVLGFSEEIRDAGMVWFSIGEEEKTTILLHSSDKTEPVDYGISFDILVDDVDLLIETVKQAGTTILQEPINREWGVREAIIADPDGYKLWFIQTIQ